MQCVRLCDVIRIKLKTVSGCHISIFQSNITHHHHHHRSLRHINTDFTRDEAEQNERKSVRSALMAASRSSVHISDSAGSGGEYFNLDYKNDLLNHQRIHLLLSLLRRVSKISMISFLGHPVCKVCLSKIL